MTDKICGGLHKIVKKYIRIGDRIYVRGCFDCIQKVLGELRKLGVLSGDYEINTGKEKEGEINGN